MAKSTVEDLRSALSEVLKIYNIKLEEPRAPEGEVAENDFSEIVGKTQSKLDDLSEKAEEIYKRTGMTREQLEVYAANPNNFTTEQWEALQKVKAACERYKQEVRGRMTAADPQYEEKVVKQKRQKQLHRFAKKKHWIPL